MTNSSPESRRDNPDSAEGNLWRAEVIRQLYSLNGQAHDLDKDAELDARERHLRKRKLYVKKAPLEIPGIVTETVLMTPSGVRPIPSLAPIKAEIPMLVRQAYSKNDPSVLLHFPVDEREKTVWLKITDENKEQTRIMLTSMEAIYYDHDEPLAITDDSYDSQVTFAEDLDISVLLERYRPVDPDYVDHVFKTVMQFNVTPQENNFPVL